MLVRLIAIFRNNRLILIGLLKENPSFSLFLVERRKKKLSKAETFITGVTLSECQEQKSFLVIEPLNYCWDYELVVTKKEQTWISCKNTICLWNRKSHV